MLYALGYYRTLVRKYIHIIFVLERMRLSYCVQARVYLNIVTEDSVCVL